MHFSGDTLDDILNDVLRHLLSKKNIHEASRGKAFSALGELMWYLSGSDSLEFIYNYVKLYAKEQIEDGAVYGAYGPRMFDSTGIISQVDIILNLLRSKPSSRKAVIQLFEAKDIRNIEPDKTRSAPCTCSIQLLLRDNKLHMIVNMRSNDAFIGLPHDIFAFTMLQEIFASELKVKLGPYTHFVGSLHLYQTDYSKAKDYLEEGFQTTVDYMPAMPEGTTLIELKKVLSLEESIRLGKPYDIEKQGLDVYWKDLTYLLAFHQNHQQKNSEGMKEVMSKISEKMYRPILEKKILSSH